MRSLGRPDIHPGDPEETLLDIASCTDFSTLTVHPERTTSSSAVARCALGAPQVARVQAVHGRRPPRAAAPHCKALRAHALGLDVARRPRMRLACAHAVLSVAEPGGECVVHGAERAPAEKPGERAVESEAAVSSRGRRALLTTPGRKWFCARR